VWAELCVLQLVVLVFVWLMAWLRPYFVQCYFAVVAVGFDNRLPAKGLSGSGKKEVLFASSLVTL